MDAAAYVIIAIVFLICISDLTFKGFGTEAAGRILMAVFAVVYILRHMLTRDFKLAIGMFVYVSIAGIVYFSLN